MTRFLDIFESISISEAGVERLFSYLGRVTDNSLRNQLAVDSLENLSYIFVTKFVPAFDVIRDDTGTNETTRELDIMINTVALPLPAPQQQSSQPPPTHRAPELFRTPMNQPTN